MYTDIFPHANEICIGIQSFGDMFLCFGSLATKNANLFVTCYPLHCNIALHQFSSVDAPKMFFKCFVYSIWKLILVDILVATGNMFIHNGTKILCPLIEERLRRGRHRNRWRLGVFPTVRWFSMPTLFVSSGSLQTMFLFQIPRKNNSFFSRFSGVFCFESGSFL